MRNVTILLAVVAVLALAVAPTGAALYTLQDSTLGTVVDPTGEMADVDIDSSGGTKTYSGTAAGSFLTKAQFNALSDMYVVDFNEASGKYSPANQGSGTGLEKIEATYSGTKRVDFENVHAGGNGDDHSSQGYNYGGSSGTWVEGRIPTSGTQDHHSMGTLSGSVGDGDDDVLLHMDITMVNATGEYVKSVAFCFIAKDTETYADVTATFYMDGAVKGNVGSGSWAAVDVGDLGEDPPNTNKDVMFAYEAAVGKKITSFTITYTYADSYEDGHSDFDDLGFQVVPEPATLALLGLGGIGVLIRRRRR